MDVTSPSSPTTPHDQAPRDRLIHYALCDEHGQPVDNKALCGAPLIPLRTPAQITCVVCADLAASWEQEDGQ